MQHALHPCCELRPSNQCWLHRAHRPTCYSARSGSFSLRGASLARNSRTAPTTTGSSTCSRGGADVIGGNIVDKRDVAEGAAVGTLAAGLKPRPERRHVLVQLPDRHRPHGRGHARTSPGRQTRGTGACRRSSRKAAAPAGFYLHAPLLKVPHCLVEGSGSRPHRARSTAQFDISRHRGHGAVGGRSTSTTLRFTRPATPGQARVPNIARLPPSAHSDDSPYSDELDRCDHLDWAGRGPVPRLRVDTAAVERDRRVEAHVRLQSAALPTASHRPR
jgi:hypothetical protein